MLNSSTAREPTSIERWRLDHLADVRRVGVAAGVDDVLADRVELDADLLDVLTGEVGDRVGLGFFWIAVMGVTRFDQWSMSQGPAAALMQVWMRTPPLSDSPA